LEKRNGYDVGRDPRRLSHDELIVAGHKPMSPLKALRLRCLDCCADQPSEVRRCTAVACPSWPFRMGSNPWRKEASDAQREQARTLALKRRSGAENQRNGRPGITTPGMAGTCPPAAMPLEKNRPNERAVANEETS
jgi:hypothetical protein